MNRNQALHINDTFLETRNPVFYKYNTKLINYSGLQGSTYCISLSDIRE